MSNTQIHVFAFALAALGLQPCPAQQKLVDLERATNWGAPLYWQAAQPATADVKRAMRAEGTESTTAAQSLNALAVFVAAPPCRLVDTRTGQGLSGAFGPPMMMAGQARTLPVPTSHCAIPAATAYSLNITAAPSANVVVGYVKAWPTGETEPNTAVLTDTIAGAFVSNAAVVGAGTDGSIQVLTQTSTDLVIDINGYYLTPAEAQAEGMSIVGLQGPIGPMGPMGPIGPQGSAGAAGVAGVAGPPVTFKQSWLAATTYVIGDAVSFTPAGGVASSYVALIGNTNVQPDSDVAASAGNWALLAQAGATGPQGVVGPAGATGAGGATGATGAGGATGATGATGAAGLGMLMSGIGLGTDATAAKLETDSGGLSTTVSVLPLAGFLASPISTTVVSGVPQFPAGGYAGLMQVLPAAVTFTKMYGQLTTVDALALIGTNITVTAQLYRYTSGVGAQAVSGATCTFAPTLAGSVASGTTSTCELTGASAAFAAGDSGFIVVSAAVTAGIAAAATIYANVSVGVSQ